MKHVYYDCTCYSVTLDILIFAKSAHSGSVFLGVEDAMFEATSFTDWQEVYRQLSLLAVHIRYAANILNQYTNPLYNAHHLTNTFMYVP